MTELVLVKTDEVYDYVLQLADKLEAQYKAYTLRSLEKYNSDYSNRQIESNSL